MGLEKFSENSPVYSLVEMLTPFLFCSAAPSATSPTDFPRFKKDFLTERGDEGRKGDPMFQKDPLCRVLEKEFP